jgi:hypothetical protein
MSSWIFRANPGRFRIHDYLRDVGYVEYLQREKVEEGDIIYLYITGKAKRVEYKMVVERANIPFVEAEDDSSYSLRKPIETFLVIWVINGYRPCLRQIIWCFYTIIISTKFHHLRCNTSFSFKKFTI